MSRFRCDASPAQTWFLVSLRRCLWLMMFCAGGANLEAAMIVLTSSAEVTHPVILLADVAEIRENDPELARQLRQITLAPTPAPGRNVRLDYAQVRARLAAQGVNLAELEFSGSSVVVVSHPEERVQRTIAPNRQKSPELRISQNQKERTEGDIAEAVQEALTKHVPQLGHTNVTVELGLEQVGIFAQAATNQFEIAGGRAPFTGSQVFEVRFLDRAGQVQRAAVRCQVDLMPAVLVLKHAVARGERLTVEDLAWERVDTQTHSDTPIRDPIEAVGMEAARVLREGDVLTQKMLRSPILVQSGNIVTVASRRGNIVITTAAKARSSGSLNEIIELVTLEGREKLQARVVGFRSVEVLASNADATAGDTGIRYQVAPPANRNPDPHSRPTQTTAQSTLPGRPPVTSNAVRSFPSRDMPETYRFQNR